MPVINTNTASQYAQDALKVNAKATSSVMQQLSTGSRINAARDDAAGLSLSQNMTSQVRGLNQAVRNANDGINQLQTADGGLIETGNMLQRMRELAVQSSNGTNSASQRLYLNNEFASLTTEINRIASGTTWNKDSLYSTTLVFQVGMNSGNVISIVMSAMDAVAIGVSTTATISTFTGAQTIISSLDNAIDTVNSARSNMGAIMNQLSYSADNLTNISSNIAASRSTIMDTDYATASAQLAKNQIIQQAATAMLAQANQQPQSVLSLLKG